MAAKGYLSTDEVGEFVKNLAHSKVKDFCEVTVSFNANTCIGRPQCAVVAWTKIEHGKILTAVFKTPLFQDMGWRDKFHLVECES